MNWTVLLAGLAFACPLFAQNPMLLPAAIEGPEVVLTLAPGEHDFGSGIGAAQAVEVQSLASGAYLASAFDTQGAHLGTVRWMKNR